MLHLRPLDAGDVSGALRLYDILTVGPKGQDPDAFARVIAHPGTQIMGGFLDQQKIRLG